MNIVTNEYVHADSVSLRLDGTIHVTYEPLENLGVVSLNGHIYIRRRACHPFSSAGTRGELYFLIPPIVDQTPVRQNVLWSRFNVERGVIVLLWDSDPGWEHYLCVSYHFEEPLIETAKINWKAEGF